ncbi:unnamed protein product [Ixodes hexagonus]
MLTPLQVLRHVAVAVLLAAVCAALEGTAETSSSPAPTVDPEILEMEEGFEALSEDMTRFVTRQLLPIVNEILYDPRLSTGCAGGLLKIGTALRSSDVWALQSKSLFGL